MSTLTLAEVSRLATEAYNRMEIERDGELTPDDRAWNLGVGPRIFHVLEPILAHARRRRLDHLAVLNMSGMNEGKPDPVLFDILTKHWDREGLSWSVVDHPQSLTFQDERVRRWTAERGISCIPHDHRNGAETLRAPPADVVLCTEIVEHLDYSDTIALLRACRAALKPGGLLIVTTPNPLYLGYRALFALGRWDFLHFNDAPENVAQGLVGHIMYYDAKRLSRLLTALDFTSVAAITFNANHGPGEFRNALTRAAAISLRTMSRAGPYSRQVLQVTGERPFSDAAPPGAPPPPSPT